MTEQTSSSIDAYTIAFSHKAFNEADIAREMAEFAGVNHHIIPIAEEDLADNLEDALWHNESPLINGNGVAKYLLSRAVRDAGHKVVLTGEGADEVLGGYSYFREDLYLQQAAEQGADATAAALEQLHQANRVTAGMFDGGDPNADLRSLEAALGYIPTQLKAPTLIAARMRSLVSPEFTASGQPAYVNFLASLNLGQISQRETLNRSLYVHSKSMLPNYILTALGDRAEMAHSIEGRVPFLDHKVVEYLARVPSSLKIKAATEKYLLREAVKDRITHTLYTRQKHPFVAPPAMMKNKQERTNPLRTLMADAFNGSELRNLPFYDQAKVLAMLDKAMNNQDGPKDGSQDVVLMHILSLCILQKRYKL